MLDVIAGLYMGEGHFSLSKQPRKNGSYGIQIEVGFSNSDPALVDLVCSWLDSESIHHFVRQNSQNCYQLIVSRLSEIKKLIDILGPKLIGNKRAEANLLKRYVENRLALMIGKKGNNVPYSENDLAIVDAKRQLRESSTTKSVPECCDRHGLNGATYSPYRDVVFNDITKRWNVAS